MIINSNEKVGGEELLRNQGWGTPTPAKMEEAPRHDMAVATPEQKVPNTPYTPYSVTTLNPDENQKLTASAAPTKDGRD